MPWGFLPSEESCYISVVNDRFLTLELSAEGLSENHKHYGLNRSRTLKGDASPRVPGSAGSTARHGHLCSQQDTSYLVIFDICHPALRYPFTSVSRRCWNEHLRKAGRIAGWADGKPRFVIRSFGSTGRILPGVFLIHHHIFASMKRLKFCVRLCITLFSQMREVQARHK